MVRQPGFFDVDERYAALSRAGDPLEKLLAVVDFEVFRKALNKALKYADRRQGGRPPFDPVMMFKIMVLQALYSLSDDQAEYLCRDRLSFMRFLGLSLSDTAHRHDLTYQQKWANAARSKVRSHVEHVFAEQKARMGLFVRTIGIKRAKVKIGMVNLAFNMKRLVFIEGKRTPGRIFAPA